MEDVVVRMPPRNNKQELAAKLRMFADQAEVGEIESLALIICRPCETPESPGMSLYQWRTTVALIGALQFLAHEMRVEIDP